MTCVFVVLSLASSRCSWVAGSLKVALRVNSDFSRLVGGRALPPLCSLARIAYVFSMYMRVCAFVVVRRSSNGVPSLTPSSHRGARCLMSSLYEYISIG